VRKKRKTRRKVGRKSKASDLSSEPSTASGAAAEPISQAIWSPEEIAAFEPPEEICPSAWAEKYRELTRRQSSRPGQWLTRISRRSPGSWICARAQRPRAVDQEIRPGRRLSEAIRNLIAWTAHLDPVPVMLVLPNEKKGREIVRKRIIPLFEDTEC
jgi:phage terminase large subunit GpA-like protein